ncbi:hypothetical protein V6Z12_D02G137400 [Gossypium hirsutum]
MKKAKPLQIAAEPHNKGLKNISHNQAKKILQLTPKIAKESTKKILLNRNHQRNNSPPLIYEQKHYQPRKKSKQKIKVQIVST